MNGLTEFFHRLARGVFRIVLIAAVGIFLLSFLLATLVIMVGVSIWSLITGRKPDPARIFGQFRQTSARYTRGTWPGNGGSAQPQGDIVDVPVHEVRDGSAKADSGKGPGTPPPGSGPMARMLH